MAFLSFSVVPPGARQQITYTHRERAASRQE
jgi:hypothetical protein